MQTETLIVIPDLHGNPIWKEIVSQKKYRKIVFLGDYFDSRNINICIDDELNNFAEILKFREENSDRVILLCGNHDLHYLSGVFSMSSGNQPEHSEKINAVLQPIYESQILKMSHYDFHTETMFSHAGISRLWFENLFGNELYNPSEMENLINLLFWKHPEVFEYQHSEDDCDLSGESEKEGPCWIRPFSVLHNLLPFTQVVGHTQQKVITKIGNVYFTDTLNSGTGTLEL